MLLPRSAAALYVSVSHYDRDAAPLRQTDESVLVLPMPRMSLVPFM